MDLSNDIAARGARFRELHAGPGLFVIPNPWDAGTAKLLTSLGFAALATTSAGLAHAWGRPDGQGAVSRDETLANARDIIAATHLPVAADLENGFAHSAEGVAETIRLAGEAGLVGGSIEDATGEDDQPIYDFNQAVERVAAGAEAAHALPLPFVFAARAENFLHERRDLDDTIRRLQAFEAVGADLLYAPGLPDLEAIRTVCAAVTKPVNVLIGGSGPAFSLTELAEAGVRRVSLGSALSRAALGAVNAAARELLDTGTTSFAKSALPYAEAQRLMSD